MELANRAVGFLLSFISLSIFSYYTFLGHYPGQFTFSFFFLYRELFYFCYFGKKSIAPLDSLCFNLLVDFCSCIHISAFCRQWSFHPTLLPSSRIFYINTCICWCGAPLLPIHIHWITYAQNQKEESLVWLFFQSFFS